MGDKISYEGVAADIVKMLAATNQLQTQETASRMCQVFSEFLKGFVEQSNGYMVMAAFIVSFTEMKKVIDHAPAEHRGLLRELTLSIIGSFGKVVQ